MAKHRLSLGARQAQIVKASMALFARKGFSGTTTRELARAARVSEALIFRLFPTKRALYSAIIQHRIVDAARRPEPGDDGSASDRDAFRRMAEAHLRRVRDDSTFMRLMLYSALEGHALSEMYYEAHVNRTIDRLRRRLEAGIRAGRYRAVDPYLAARAFQCMVIHYALSQELFLRRRHPAPPDRVARTFADIFFSGLEKVSLPALPRAGKRKPGQPGRHLQTEAAAPVPGEGGEDIARRDGAIRDTTSGRESGAGSRRRS
jgi:AcrR family transcriptional regulator